MEKKNFIKKKINLKKKKNMKKKKKKKMKIMEVIIIVIILLLGIGNGLGCHSEEDRDVDYWIMIKLPKITTADEPYLSGVGYAYMDTGNGALNLTGRSLKTDGGALKYTLDQIYNGDLTHLAYGMYNDQTPNGQHSSFGHTKGVIAFDEEGHGFWLLHSIPRFPVPDQTSYIFPDNEDTYGQSLMCFTLSSVEDVEAIAAAYNFSTPYIFESNFPVHFGDHFPRMATIFGGDFERTAGSVHVPLFTIAGIDFHGFAKNGAFGKDIYEYVAQPYIKVGCYWETWMNGPIKDKMPSYCSPDYAYDSMNIAQVAIGGIVWKETKDHSKWGVSMEQSQPWFCIGGMNRMSSQWNRQGLTVCFKSPDIWLQFNQMILDANGCPSSF